MQWRQSTRLRNKVKKARMQRIANYLRALDEQNTGQPHRSLCLEVQNNNANGPIYKVILFGEAGFWHDEENETGPPPDGYKILVDN
jgi:hypothetical protein